MSKEAMKLALKALEQIKRLTGARWALENNYAGHLEAITALREALAEQPAQQRTEELLEIFKDVDQCGPLLGMGQPAQQEPVAIVAVDGIGQIQIGWMKKPQHNDKLYTSPPAQRKPLTDEEIESINVRLAGNRDLARLFARAIEAKLKEKNT